MAYIKIGTGQIRHCIPYIPAVKATARNGKRTTHLSKDAKWRPFPKVPNLLQYVSTGTYYGRIKVKGKIIRQSCHAVFKTGQFIMGDWRKEEWVLFFIGRSCQDGVMA
ncbi:MAG: hypothetical protein AAB466_12165 [Verrucomicrobiota bacterium]